MQSELQNDYSPEGGTSGVGRSFVRVLKWTVLLALCLVLFTGIGAAAGVLLYAGKMVQPAEPGEPVRVDIPTGSSSARIADILEEHGIIRSSLVFRYYLRLHNEGSRFQAGEYELAPGMTLERIISALNRGETIMPDMIRFTIPEGYTVQQMAERLGQEPGLSADVFMSLAASQEIEQSWAGRIPDDPNIRYRLEGYLFPETYELLAASTERDIVIRMLGELDRKLRQLPEGWESRLEQLGISFHQMMTIASLIEREVVVDAERGVVAGVIYNRLNQRWPLQIDATVQYLLDKPKERLLYVDLEVESPYNTYLHPGIPPGPIAAPGLKSIEAALYPQETPYMFYVTKKDGSGEHYFGVTLQQHNNNIATSNRNAAAR